MNKSFLSCKYFFSQERKMFADKIFFHSIEWRGHVIFQSWKNACFLLFLCQTTKTVKMAKNAILSKNSKNWQNRQNCRFRHFAQKWRKSRFWRDFHFWQNPKKPPKPSRILPKFENRVWQTRPKSVSFLNRGSVVPKLTIGKKVLDPPYFDFSKVHCYPIEILGESKGVPL